jgi:cysteine desulfurase
VLARAEGGRWAERCRGLQARMLEALRPAGVKCYGAAPGAGRDPRHLCLGFPGCQGEMMMLRLDLEGVCVGAGAGCLAPDEKVSPVLRAMGVSREEAFGVLLVGLRPELTEEEVDRAAEALVKTSHRQRQSIR